MVVFPSLRISPQGKERGYLVGRIAMQAKFFVVGAAISLREA
jgi:hypothetical protein